MTIKSYYLGLKGTQDSDFQDEFCTAFKHKAALSQTERVSKKTSKIPHAHQGTVVRIS